MIRTATIFRHMLDNGPGVLEPALRARGIAITMIDTFIDSLDGFDPLGPDLLLVLGGGCGVYQSNLFPFLKDELAILRTRLDADRPTLGICLGAQLMAEALGSPVFKGLQGPEIGWQTLQINEAGQQTPLRHFDAAQTRIMQWHGDTFDLPDGATLLASSEIYAQQAFQWGKNCLGFQGHIEVEAGTVQSWLVSAAGDTLDFHRLQTDTKKWAGVMQGQTEKFINEWLDQMDGR